MSSAELVLEFAKFPRDRADLIADGCDVDNLGGTVLGRPDTTVAKSPSGPGDVVDLDPGHDAWTVGDEPCVMLDTGVGADAKPS